VLWSCCRDEGIKCFGRSMKRVAGRDLKRFLTMLDKQALTVF